MKTQVETFEIQDVREETVEQSAEAIALIGQLGLKGQLAKTETPTETRFPYRLMTNEELFVYSTICPSRASVEDYDLGPIPLEVLKTIAFARSLNDPRIPYLSIWAADSSRVKDPVLVGSERYGSKYYILARWGEELLPLQVLLPDAIKRWWSIRQDKLAEIKRKVDAALQSPCPIGMPVNPSEPYCNVD